MSNITIEKGLRVYFIGIGGVSMSGIAQMLVKEGCIVSGSDRSASVLTEALVSQGITVHFGHNAENVKDCDLIVYSAAIPYDNPERVRARELGIPEIDRAEMLGMVMKEYDCPIAISGTHGKTTTSGMLSHVFIKCEKNPTITIGGVLDIIHGNVHLGGKEFFIAEACEYHQSFLRFFPKISVITNIEADHLDYFKDLDHIIDTFRSLALLTPEDGALIVNADDENVLRAIEGVDRNIITFGIKNDCDYTVTDLSKDDLNSYSFTVCKKNNSLGRIQLSVPGMHNVYNALAAFIVADYAGLDTDEVCDAFTSFIGTKRRFELRGITNGITIVDDYAHHPTEIAATLNSTHGMKFKNVWCVFQPHTYTRTYALLDEFAKVFSESKANIIITDIFAAREVDTGLVTSQQLANAIPGAIHKKSFEDVVEFIRAHAQSGDLVITMGAGDVYKIGDILLSVNE